MRKILIAFVIGALLVLALATTALADNGPHGGFTATTDACAGCHRAHSAQVGNNSLLLQDPEKLCLGCHDGSGAGTDVEDGVYVQGGGHNTWNYVEGTPNSPLFGGGFENALMATAWTGNLTPKPGDPVASGRPTTSHHNLGTPGTVWGSNGENTTNDQYTLECTSCHDPHGKAGYLGTPDPTDPTKTVWSKAESYRLLRWQPQGSNGFTPPATQQGFSVNWSGGAFPNQGTVASPNYGWLVPDNFATFGTEWYTIGTKGRFAFADYQAGWSGSNPGTPSGNASEIYNLKNSTATETKTYIPAAVNVAFFCAQCHDRYFNNSSLRNNVDPSAYCNGGNPATIPPPTSAADVHPTHPTECIAGFNSRYPAAPGSWVWGDVRGTLDATYKFRHSSGDIRQSMDGVIAAGAGTSLSRSCVACHVAHGTAATMTTLANGATLVPGGSSVLLRMDNRTICLRCHADTVNFTPGP